MIYADGLALVVIDRNNNTPVVDAHFILQGEGDNVALYRFTSGHTSKGRQDTAFAVYSIIANLLKSTATLHVCIASVMSWNNPDETDPAYLLPEGDPELARLTFLERGASQQRVSIGTLHRKNVAIVPFIGHFHDSAYDQKTFDGELTMAFGSFEDMQKTASDIDAIALDYYNRHKRSRT